jgi:hypothetical protein
VEDVEIEPGEELREHETGLRNTGGDVLPISLSTSLLHDKRQNPIGLSPLLDGALLPGVFE